MLTVTLGVLGIISLFSAAPLAAEPGNGALPRQDEGAPCDQVRELCEQARQRDAEFRAAKRRVEQDSTADNVDRYRAAFLANEAAFLKLAKVAATFWKEHGQVPPCFRQCPTLSDFLKELKTAPRSGA